jgi:AmmeMemoRadiSam system protein A
MEISAAEKKLLLETARKSINSFFTNEVIPKPNYEKHPILKSNCGAFVTLTQDGKLRGCIGYIISDKPLFDTICDAAIQASQNDPRFPSVKQHEVEDIHIEISLLSEPFPLAGYDEIVVGKHGLILEEKGYRGLLLPQVPIEHGMNKEEYLDAICRKTGLPAGYWREKKLKLSGFTATVFSEELNNNEN